MDNVVLVVSVLCALVSVVNFLLCAYCLGKVREHTKWILSAGGLSGRIDKIDQMIHALIEEDKKLMELVGANEESD